MKNYKVKNLGSSLYLTIQKQPWTLSPLIFCEIQFLFDKMFAILRPLLLASQTHCEDPKLKRISTNHKIHKQNFLQLSGWS